MHPGGRLEGTRAFFARWRASSGGADRARARGRRDPDAVPPGLTYVTGRLYQAVLTKQQLHDLIADDRRDPPPTIFKAWPDYTMTAHIDRSAATVKSDAARRTYAGAGQRDRLGGDATPASTPRTRTSPASASPPIRRRGRRPPPEGAAPSRTAGLHRDFTGLVRVPPDPTHPSLPGPRPAPGTTPPPRSATRTATAPRIADIIAGRCPPGATPWVATSEEPLDQPYVVRTPSTSSPAWRPSASSSASRCCAWTATPW